MVGMNHIKGHQKTSKEVVEIIKRSPCKSTNRFSQEVEMNKASAHQILRKFLLLPLQSSNHAKAKKTMTLLSVSNLQNGVGNAW